MKITKNCIVCGTEYTKPYFTSRYEWSLRKYCGNLCKNKSKIGKIPWNKGLPWDEATKKKFSNSHKGKPAHNKGIPASEETKQKIREARKKQIITSEQARRSIETRRRRYGYVNSPSTRKKLKEHFTGEKSHWWQGGKSREAHRIRESGEYKEWRRKVYERDEYTCQLCGQRGGKLAADHIKPFAYFPELRFELSNGRTLCVPCHKQTDTFGKWKSK